MDHRISLITLAARDPEALAGFYEALGWQRVETVPGMVVFDLLGQAIGIYSRDALAEDMGVEPETLGHGAMTLAHNVGSAEEVDALMARAEAAGAKILRPGGGVHWGGHIGYFSDPEGHVWEIAHNPFSPLRAEDGAFRWRGY
ncbi:VOC family protein [Salipiger mangrovisoli]|uniref:VOC family protein n=1 Tax=Salipiger mangrovisoli TaxID=2865933 RepID=A0ABR9X828_9RHOB|nr:VOC family protein [Salipiger mangrovisoli]MBE9639750.1 VOC family protein [Salipiger mangrovisoli]